MSVNCSLPLNTSLHPSCIFNFFSFLKKCFNSTVGLCGITIFTILCILLLLPLCVFVLYQGHQRWRQRRSRTTTSHSDVFTFNAVCIELLNVSGVTLSCCGIHTGLPQMIQLGIFLIHFNVSGQIVFHVLTCVERYLAVVHPVTYLSLRKANGIRIRNITIGCGWLSCFLAPSVLSMAGNGSMTIVSFSTTSFAFLVICFCSLSVLCVLIRPGPGEGGGSRQRVDQSKLRAFKTIVAIMGVLLLKFGGTILVTALFALSLLGENERCTVWLSLLWFNLPSSLVLPLLFLQRAGKLVCCKGTSQSGRG